MRRRLLLGLGGRVLDALRHLLDLRVQVGVRQQLVAQGDRFVVPL